MYKAQTYPGGCGAPICDSCLKKQNTRMGTCAAEGCSTKICYYGKCSTKLSKETSKHLKYLYKWNRSSKCTKTDCKSKDYKLDQSIPKICTAANCDLGIQKKYLLKVLEMKL